MLPYKQMKPCWYATLQANETLLICYPTSKWNPVDMLPYKQMKPCWYATLQANESLLICYPTNKWNPKDAIVHPSDILMRNLDSEAHLFPLYSSVHKYNRFQTSWTYSITKKNNREKKLTCKRGIFWNLAAIM